MATICSELAGGAGLRLSPSWWCLSGQSFVTAYVEGLPFEKRLGLDPLLQRGVGGQERPVDFPSVQQQVQKCALGIGERQNVGQNSPAFLNEPGSVLRQCLLIPRWTGAKGRPKLPRQFYAVELDIIGRDGPPVPAVHAAVSDEGGAEPFPLKFKRIEDVMAVEQVSPLLARE